MIATKQQNQRGRDSDEDVCSDDINDTDIWQPYHLCDGPFPKKKEVVVALARPYMAAHGRIPVGKVPMRKETARGR